jgi:hypothetical protein
VSLNSIEVHNNKTTNLHFEKDTLNFSSQKNHHKGYINFNKKNNKILLNDNSLANKAIKIYPYTHVNCFENLRSELKMKPENDFIFNPNTLISK